MGRPNVGKSTLINRLVGKPISITANKPQTTRNQIMGVVHGDDHQVVYVDTPGIHEVADAFGNRLVRTAQAALQDVDVILLLVEPVKGPGATPHAADSALCAMAVQLGTPTLLLINKTDRVTKETVLESIGAYAGLGTFEEIVPISALKGHNVPRLHQLVRNRLKEGPQYFEPDQITDQSERQIIGEMVRQEVFRHLRQEIPYSTAVIVEALEDTPRLLKVHASIFVERESQKGMIIGKGGRMLKTIGTSARQQLEKLLGTSIYLALQVSVKKNWSGNTRGMAEMGYPDP